MRRERTKLNMSMIAVIMSLAWPTMLEQLMQTAVQYIDTAMVGSLGTQATAAVGATSTVNWLVSSTISALGVGFLAYIAQALGAGDELKARRASSQAVLGVLVSGIFFLQEFPKFQFAHGIQPDGGFIQKQKLRAVQQRTAQLRPHALPKT